MIIGIDLILIMLLLSIAFAHTIKAMNRSVLSKVVSVSNFVFEAFLDYFGKLFSAAQELGHHLNTIFYEMTLLRIILPTISWLLGSFDITRHYLMRLPSLVHDYLHDPVCGNFRRHCVMNSIYNLTLGLGGLYCVLNILNEPSRKEPFFHHITYWGIQLCALANLLFSLKVSDWLACSQNKPPTTPGATDVADGPDIVQSPTSQLPTFSVNEPYEQDEELPDPEQLLRLHLAEHPIRLLASADVERLRRALTPGLPDLIAAKFDIIMFGVDALAPNASLSGSQCIPF